MANLLEEFEKLSNEYFHGGKADNKSDDNYDSEELRKGMNVEMEHTNDRKKAKEIARDHLEEHGKYYTHLDKMEKRLEKSAKADPGKKGKQTAADVLGGGFGAFASSVPATLAVQLPAMGGIMATQNIDKRMTKSEAEKLIREVGKEHGIKIKTRVGVNPGARLENAGWMPVTDMKAGDALQKKQIKAGDVGTIITDSRTPSRSTVAHELGHAIQHKKNILPRLPRVYGISLSPALAGISPIAAAALADPSKGTDRAKKIVNIAPWALMAPRLYEEGAATVRGLGIIKKRHGWRAASKGIPHGLAALGSYATIPLGAQIAGRIGLGLKERKMISGGRLKKEPETKK